VIITGGSGIHCTGGAEYPISRGDVFVINVHQTHGYRDIGPLALVNILFCPDELNLPLKDLATVPGYNALFKLEPAWRERRGFRSRLRLSVSDLAGAEQIISAMEEELEKKSAGYQFVAVSLLMQLIGRLARCYTRSQTADCHAFIRLADAIEHLETHYDQAVTLSQLAGMVHLSVRHFQRSFWKIMGSSPIDHLVRLRITRGSELLRQEKDLNITEIAYRVGFQDSNYFTRQFHRIMGCSPREYRHKNAG
jgi:AraC-like DNA-binding protein